VNPLVINCTTSHILLRLLHSPLSVSFHHHLNRSYLLHTIVLTANELIDEQVFSNHDALLIYNIIELSLFLLNYVLLIILLIVIIVVFFIIEIFLWLLLLLFLLISLIIELVQDVLDLPLELLVALLHQVLQDLRHA